MISVEEKKQKQRENDIKRRLMFKEQQRLNLIESFAYIKEQAELKKKNGTWGFPNSQIWLECQLVV